MKIRTGFVSNSSSSSFVVFYLPATFSDLKDGNKNITLIGEAGSEGRDYFKPDKETVEYLLSHPKFAQDNFEYYNELFSGSEDGEVDIKDFLNKLPTNGKIRYMAFEGDNWNSDNWENFENAYLKEW